MTIAGMDVSHYQSPIDFAAAKRAGNAFVVLKATESTNYNDPTCADYRVKAHAAGLMVGLYHFARAGDVAREAAWFCQNVGALAPGEFVVLDWEVPASNPPAWCLGWLDRVTATLGVKPFIYLNQSARDGSDWSRVVAGGYPLWLAKYDNSPAKPTGGDWPSVAMKQYTSSGTVPGIAGGVDLDVFYGDTAALAALSYSPPRTGGFLMALSDAEQHELLEAARYLKKGGEQDLYVHEIPARAAGAVAVKASAQVDPKALAAALAPLVVAALGQAKGLTAADVEAAMRKVFASASTA